MKNALILIFLLLVTSCASVENYSKKLDSFKGKSVASVIEEWGYPDQTTVSPNSNKLLVYSESSISSSGVSCREDKKGNTSCSGGGTTHNSCKTFFEIDSSNTVIGTSFRGNDCGICVNEDSFWCM